MKKLLLGTALCLIVPATALAVQAPKKITICHATSSATNPWVRIVVSENATAGHFDNNGTAKAGHEKDVLLEGEQDCPVEVTPTPSVTPTPVVTPTPTPTPVKTVTVVEGEDVSYGGK